MSDVRGYRSPGRKALAAEGHGHSTGPSQAPMAMGGDVPQAVREDETFQQLFRDSQRIKNSRRPADQKQLADLLGKMRARWGELTGESNGN